MAKIVVVASVLLWAESVVVVDGCFSNTDCTNEYSGTDRCFMEATFEGESNEGFCNGSPYGDCMAKLPLGADCSAYNEDNNVCVTRLCQDGVCKLRTSGCASVGDCVDSFADSVTGVIMNTISNLFPEDSCSESTPTCDDPNASCEISVSLPSNADCPQQSQLDTDLISGSTFTIGKSKSEQLTLTMSGNFNLEVDAPTVDANVKDLKFSVSTGYKLDTTGLGVTLSAKSSKNKEIDESYILTNGKAKCDDMQGTSCEKFSIFEKAIVVGKATFFLKIGVQLTARVTGSFEAEGTFESEFGLDSDESSIIADTIGFSVELAGDGAISLDTPNFEISLAPTVKSLTLSASSAANLQVVIGAEVSIEFNGVQMELASQAKFEFKAQGDQSGCASAQVSGGIGIGVYTPKSNVSKLFKALCASILGTAAKKKEQQLVQKQQQQQQISGTGGERYYSSSSWEKTFDKDRYGTQCVVDLTTPEGRKDACDTVVDIMSDLSGGFGGSCFPGISHCVGVGFSSGVWTSDCSSTEHISYKCGPFVTVMTDYDDMCEGHSKSNLAVILGSVFGVLGFLCCAAAIAFVLKK